MMYRASIHRSPIDPFALGAQQMNVAYVVGRDMQNHQEKQRFLARWMVLGSPCKETACSASSAEASCKSFSGQLQQQTGVREA